MKRIHRILVVVGVAMLLISHIATHRFLLIPVDLFILAAFGLLCHINDLTK